MEELARPIGSKPSLCPMVKDVPSKHLFTKHLLSHLHVICLPPLGSSNDYSTSLHPGSRLHTTFNCSVCPWAPYSYGTPFMYICNSTWLFSPVILSHVNFIIQPARRTKKREELSPSPISHKDSVTTTQFFTIMKK